MCHVHSIITSKNLFDRIPKNIEPAFVMKLVKIVQDRNQFIGEFQNLKQSIAIQHSKLSQTLKFQFTN